MISDLQRHQKAQQITLIGAIVNASLGIIKVVGGILFHSHALVADGIHSFADLVTDALVMIASKFGNLEADESHPYGHKRIETAGVLFLSLLLIAAGAGIGFDALKEVYSGQHDIPQTISLYIALLSIFANEILFFFTKKIGIAIDSQLIIANAWHHRADSASSFVVFVGILGSLLGFIYSDALAAIIVSLLVIKMGVEFSWASLHELVDSAVDEEKREEIKKIILSVEGVEKVHQLRTRYMAGDIYIDVHVLVNPLISVSEGHYIAQQVHRYLKKQIAKVKDVTVHVDPEDDEIEAPTYPLPSRPSLEQQYFTQWQNEYPFIEAIHLHYLKGQVHIDLNCLGPLKTMQALYIRVSDDTKHDEAIGNVQILKKMG